MVSRRPSEPSPDSIARANRRRLAQEEGVRAMADVERKAVAVRKNMERLRGLREAMESAKDAEAAAPAPVAARSKKGRALRK